MIRPAIFLPLAALALTACGDKGSSDNQGKDGRRAEGEVLGGSISDAMIPLDTLTSQSPPMKIAPKAAEGTPATDRAEADSAPDEATDAAPPEQPAEAATPVEAAAQ